MRIVLLVMLSFSWGCGARPATDLPKTYPVTGNVFDVSNRPMTGGFVEFQSKTDQNVMAIGNIQPDGSFVVSTYIDGTEVTGAVPGEHAVTVHPPQLEHGGAEPIHIRQTYIVEAKANEITLNLSHR